MKKIISTQKHHVLPKWKKLFDAIVHTALPPIIDVTKHGFKQYARYAYVHDNLLETPEYQPLQTEIDTLRTQLQHLEKHKTPNFDAIPPIIISGAGLAGLFLACYLEKKGITNYEVHEKRSRAEFNIRPNNVQARGDYRSKNPFVLIDELNKIFPPELVDYIQDISLVFNQASRPEKADRTDRLVFSVGNVQKKIFEDVLPDHRIKFGVVNESLEKASKEGFLVFNARGARPNNDPNPRIIRAGKPIKSGHSWCIDSPNSDGSSSWENFEPGIMSGPSCFVANTHMQWSQPIKHANTQEKHDFFFSVNLLKRAIQDCKRKERPPEIIAKLEQHLSSILEEGSSITHLNYRLAHRPEGSDFAANLMANNVLSYSLTTTPNICVPDEDHDVFPIGDALSRPHPYAAHGMLGVFKTVDITEQFIFRLSHASTVKDVALCKKLYRLELFKVGIYQTATLLAMQSVW